MSAKTIGLWFLRLFGLKRRTPQTRFGKFARISDRTLSITALVYLALLVFPQVLFAYNVNVKGVTVYSRTPLPPETATRIDQAMELVNRSELAVPGRTELVFVCDQPWLYRLFCPITGKSFGTSFPVTNNIFVGETDLVNNVTRSRTAIHNRRTFSGVVAHEITHNLIRRRLGLIRGMLLPRWVNEGYSDYVAQESSFPADEGFRRLREGEEETSGSFQYFVYRQMVRHLVEDRHCSFEELVKQAGDSEAIKAETIAALRKEPAK